VSEWYNITGVLSGWARRFDARRGLFHSAANAGAQGAKDKCIVHTMGNGNIQLNLWFPTEEGLQRFDAALAVSAEVFGNHTMKLERKKAPPPTPDLAAVFALDYTKDKDSPQPYATSNSGAGATMASGLRKKLQNQRVAITDEMTYKNMHIIPAALLGDGRKLACRWLYLAGSGEFHDWFDGPQTAPHIKVTIDKETPSMYAGETEFTLKVDTSRVGSMATITKPVLAVDSPDGTGNVTTVHIPSVQADNFRFALNWRASCFDEAWKRNAADLPVNTNDAGGHGWWHCVDLGEDLLSAIEAAKVSLEEGTDEAW
ncbi:clpC, partial [Symbiodinium sp. CCMP2456]